MDKIILAIFEIHVIFSSHKTRALLNLLGLSIFKSVSTLICFCGHESRILTTGVQSRAQAAEMVLLRIEHVSRVDEIYDNETRSILLVV